MIIVVKTFIVRAITFALVCFACDLAPSRAAPTDDGKAETPVVKTGGEADALPSPAVDAEPTRDTEKTRGECHRIVVRLGAGDYSAWEKLDSGTRSAIRLDTALAGREVYSCLAAAYNDARFCGILAESEKGKCEEDVGFSKQLSAKPLGERKAFALFQLCQLGPDKKPCETMRIAVRDGDSSKCAGIDNSDHRVFCESVAGGDAKRCESVADTDQRSWCKAFTILKAAECPSSSSDCGSIVELLARVDSEDPSALSRVAPAFSAASKGADACKPMIAKLEEVCDSL